MVVEFTMAGRTVTVDLWDEVALRMQLSPGGVFSTVTVDWRGVLTPLATLDDGLPARLRQAALAAEALLEARAAMAGGRDGAA